MSSKRNATKELIGAKVYRIESVLLKRADTEMSEAVGQGEYVSFSAIEHEVTGVSMVRDKATGVMSHIVFMDDISDVSYDLGDWDFGFTKKEAAKKWASKFIPWLYGDGPFFEPPCRLMD